MLVRRRRNASSVGEPLLNRPRSLGTPTGMAPRTGISAARSISSVASMRVLRFSNRNAMPKPPISPTTIPSAIASSSFGPEGLVGAVAGVTIVIRFDWSRIAARLAS